MVLFEHRLLDWPGWVLGFDCKFKLQSLKWYQMEEEIQQCTVSCT